MEVSVIRFNGVCVYAISVTIAICICHIIVCTVIHCYLLRHLSLLDCPLLVFVTSMSFRIVIYCCSLRHLYALYDIPCSCGPVPGDVPAAVAILLHYLFLSVFTLMLAEGVQLYVKMCLVFRRDRNVLPFILAAWSKSSTIHATTDTSSTSRRSVETLKKDTFLVNGIFPFN